MAREMVGRRIPVPIDPETGRPNVNLAYPFEPGDYCGPIIGYTGDLPAVFFLKPNARDPDVPAHARAIQHVTSPPHTFRECPDGSLEIRNSIGDMHPVWGDGGEVVGQESDGWHGFLNSGHRWSMNAE